MIFLYVKTHIYTGLRYLGKTTRDPFVYKGSGVYWKKHIKKHGYYCKTEILLATESQKEIRDTGIFFSRMWNVVESSEWANLTEERGDGGDLSHFVDGVKRKNTVIERYGVDHVSKIKAVKDKISASQIGRVKSRFEIEKMSKKRSEDSKINIKRGIFANSTSKQRIEKASLAGSGNKGKAKSEEHRRKIGLSNQRVYKVDGVLLTISAREYCAMHGHSYSNFTQAAKYNRSYKGMKVELV